LRRDPDATRIPAACLATALLATLLAAGSARAEEAFPKPHPADPRCDAMGWARGAAPIPVAWPRIQDLTPGGDLGVLAGRLATSMAGDLDLSGVFRVAPPSSVPDGPVAAWFGPAAFDYEGWRRAGAWLVVVGEMSAEPRGLRVRLDAYLAEEGDRLAFAGAEAVLPVDRVAAFGQAYVNALLKCVTGLPGAFGTRIAFARKTRPGEPKEIFTVVPGDRAPVQVSRDGELTMLPSWAPGGRLAWTGYRSGNADLWLDGRVFSDQPGQNSGAAFSPDGRLVALTVAPDGEPDIWLLDARTGAEVARLTASEAIDTSPTWSPDGRQIAFVSDRGGSPQVWMMNADGSGARPLPLPGSYNTSPDWSPDGDEILYQSRGERSRFSIWGFDVRTGAIRQLTGGPWNDEEPSWSPDGRMIAFTSTRDGRRRLYVMSRDGSGVRPVLPDRGEDFTPAWERFFPDGD
jgi:TolB protein